MLCKYVTVIKVESWDREEYPELEDDDAELIQVYEDDQGFVHLDVLDDQTRTGNPMNLQKVVKMDSTKSCARCSRPLNSVNKSEWSLCYLCQTDFSAYGKNASASPKLTEWIDGGGIKVARCVKCNMVIPVKEAVAQEGRCERHYEFLGKKRASLVLARTALHHEPRKKTNMMPKKDAAPKYGSLQDQPTQDRPVYVEGKIERNIPIPTTRGNVIPIYPWDKLAIGESFWMNKPTSIGCKLAYSMGKQLKLKFVTRKDGKGTRVWRIK
jgi:hypothetical protein